jgi:hypothetical protein
MMIGANFRNFDVCFRPKIKLLNVRDMIRLGACVATCQALENYFSPWFQNCKSVQKPNKEKAPEKGPLNWSG